MARVSDPDLAERRRRQILDAALACFSRRGFHQAGMQEICAEAGLSPGAVYRYFSSKTDIIAAIVEDGRQQVLAQIEAEPSGAGFVDGMMIHVESALLKLASPGAPPIGDIVAEASRDRALADRLMAGQAKLRAALASRLREAQADGQIDPTLDVEREARVIEAFMDGVVIRVAVAGPPAIAAALEDCRAFLDRQLGVRAARRVTAVKPTRRALDIHQET